MTAFQCPSWCRLDGVAHERQLITMRGVLGHQSCTHQGDGWEVSFAAAAWPEGEADGSLTAADDIGIQIRVDDHLLGVQSARELIAVLSAVVDVATADWDQPSHDPTGHDALSREVTPVAKQTVEPPSPRGREAGSAVVRSDLVRRYEAWMRSTDWTPRTCRQRLTRAGLIEARWDDPTAVSGMDIAEYLAEYAELKPATRQTYYNDTRAFYRWLTAMGLVEVDPFTSDLIRRPKAALGVPKPLSAEEESRALQHSDGNLRAFILLALRAGLRASEIAALRGEEVAEDHIVLIGKGGKEAAIPTHPDLWALAQSFPRRGYWFPAETEPHLSSDTISRAVGRHFRRPEVDIPHGSIHRCRHTYATNMLRNGANLRQVQTLMRHSSPATTAVYTAVDETELRGVIKTLGNINSSGD